MPNWTYNSLLVEGEPKEIKRFKVKAKKGKNLLSFEKFLPTPKELLNQQSPPKNEVVARKKTKKYGAKDWYDWRIKNWGTKWDTRPDNTELNQNNENSIEYHFDTAWSPPENWLTTISKMFPGLKFELHAEEEANMWPTFTAIVKNGQWKEK
jgi:hypothetical protein